METKIQYKKYTPISKKSKHAVVLRQVQVVLATLSGILSHTSPLQTSSFKHNNFIFRSKLYK